MTDEEKRLQHNRAMREWRRKNLYNKEYQRDYHKKYYADSKNKAIAKERSRKWYEINKEVINNRLKEKYHATKTLKGYARGNRNAGWKGDNVGYHGLHKWVVRWKGRPSECEHCGSKTAKRYEWANKSHEYKRDLNDWLRLCSKCHWHYDQSNRQRSHGKLLPN